MKALRQRLEFRRARRAGKRDGKKGIPLQGEDKTLPFDLLEIKRRGDEELWRAAQEWERQDGDRKARSAVLSSEGEEASQRQRLASERLQNLQQTVEKQASEDRIERTARMKALSAQVIGGQKVRSGVVSPSAGESPGGSSIGAGASPSVASGADVAAVASTAAQDAPAELRVGATSQMQRGEDGPARGQGESRFGMGIVPYWIAIILIIAGEVPLNAFAFRLFGEIDLFTYMMTLSLALVLVFCAHGLGIFMARRSRTFVEQALMATLVALPVAVVTVVGIIRQQSLETRAEQATPLDALGPLAGTAAFALINLLIYAGAAVLSYLRHDPATEQNQRRAIRKREQERKDSERREQTRFEKSEKRRMEAERKRAEEEDRRRQDAAKQERDDLLRRQEMQRLFDEAERSRLNGLRQDELNAVRAEDDRFSKREAGRLAQLRAANDDLGSASRAALSAAGGLKAARLARRNAWAAMNAHAMSIKTYYERLMMTYCAGNVAARKDRHTPPILRKLPELDMPASFASPPEEL